jgi:hypothetical protein
MKPQLPDAEARSSPAGRKWIALAAVLAALPLAAAAQPPRGQPASRISDGSGATEYWDLVALFDTNHKLFARFMITNEGPGRRTGVAYGHFVEPDGTTHSFRNGRREERWTLGPRGLYMKIGKSILDLTGKSYALDVHKRKKGVDIALRFTPTGPAVWDEAANGATPAVDLLAASAPIEGSVWFKGMAAPVELSGRAGLTHTWMDRSEPEVALRRLDFFSLRGEPVLYLLDLEAPDGSHRRWLTTSRDGQTLRDSSDFELRYSGQSRAQSGPKYPLPAALHIRSESADGAVQIGAGLLHHDPMEDIPQPFRFLLSFKMRPHRVWTDATYDIALKSGSDPVRIRGTGVATTTFLNPISPRH